MPNLHSARRVTLTVLAQGLSSVTNFAAGALALAASGGDLAAFGRFAIAFQLCQVVIAIAQGSTGSAVLIHGAKGEQSGAGENQIDAAAIRAGAAAWSLLIGVYLGLALIAAGLIVGGELQTPLFLAGAGSFALTSQYTLRAARFARQDAAGVVRADGTWLLVLLAAAAGDVFGGWDPTVNNYLAVWLIGAFVSALPAIVSALGPGRHALGIFWRTTGPQAVRTGGDALLARSVFVVTLILADVIVSDEASGLLAAAVLVFSPMSVVHASTLAVMVPATIRDKRIHVTGPRLPLQAFGAIALITLVWAAFLLIFNETSLAFGPFDLDAAGVTGALFAATLLRFLGMAFWRGPVIALRIADAAAESLKARTIGTIAQWVIPAIGLAIADINGGAFGLALATWFGASVAWRQYHQLR